MEVQNTRTSEARPKQKEKTKHVQNLENTLRIPLSPTFFDTMRLFFEFFLFQQRLPLQFLTFPPRPILSFSGTFFVFLPEACQVKPVEFSLLFIVTDYFFDCYDCSLTFAIFGLRYGADLGRSRLVLFSIFSQKNCHFRKRH